MSSPGLEASSPPDCMPCFGEGVVHADDGTVLPCVHCGGTGRADARKPTPAPYWNDKVPAVREAAVVLGITPEIFDFVNKHPGVLALLPNLLAGLQETTQILGCMVRGEAVATDVRNEAFYSARAVLKVVGGVA